MTKDELLEVLDKLYPCQEARNWVIVHPSDDAETIHADCKTTYWLTWLYDQLDILDEDSKAWKRYIRAIKALRNFDKAHGASRGLWTVLALWEALYAKFLPQLKLPWEVVLKALQETEF